ncbi:MAG: peptidyl-prolyl cis-trans isomerase SurA [Paraglaciecola sp.]|jgi:peptidyl-prolyl cis-trans isomerase SurA
MKLSVVTFTFLALMSITFTAIGKPQTLDSVAVIVDQGVVLESQIEELVLTVKRNAAINDQTLPSDRALRTQAIERLILDSLQSQTAERMGIQISDPQLEQTIGNIAQEDGISMTQLRDKLAADGVSYEVYREQVRKELITGEVRRANVRRRIYITPQEITNLVKLIDEQDGQQAEFHLGHILIAFPPEPTDEDVSKAQETAKKVIELLKNGSEFAKIATASSSGSKALEGGDLGWMNINSMPTLFAGAVKGQAKGDLIGPIRSGAGFHILKILDTRGIQRVEVAELNSRHILIAPSVILSDEKAEQMLRDFRKQILAGEADFAELAKQHSADTGSALRGGELGWADPNKYVPAFKDALAKLEIDEISQPVRTVHGWHLMQLTGKRIEDATEKRKEDKAYQLLFQRKFGEETEAWLKEMRDSAYIEVIAKKDQS